MAGLHANADGITRISKTNKFIKEAEEHFKNKAYKNAVKAYENALKETPELPGQLHMNLGHAYYQMKNWEQAQKQYQTAAAKLNANSLKSQSFQQIGNIWFKQQDYANALEWYKKSLKANPGNAEARFNYELAYQKAKEKAQQQPPPKADKPESQKDQAKDKQNQPGKPENKEPENQDKQQEEQKKEEEKPQNKPGKQKDKGGKSESSDEKDAPEGEEQKDKSGKSEKADEEGQENSEQKKQEAQAEDADAVRIDRKKLMESGLTVEQAKTLLNAMKQSEVKYLQQRRFKSPKGKKSSEGPRW